LVVTVAVVVATGNLAIGVVVGVVVASVLFARRVAHVVTVTSVLDPDGGERVYFVHGQVFFASSNDLVEQFDYAGDPQRVVVDMSDAHVWDASSSPRWTPSPPVTHAAGRRSRSPGSTRAASAFTTGWPVS